MHPFKQSIAETDEEYRKAAHEMVLLSERIAFAAGLSNRDIETACLYRKIFEAGDFIIEPRSCCLPGGWRNVLMVTPRCVGPGVGWSNLSHNPFPDGWEYFPKGTATVVAPSSRELTDKIVNAVRAAT